MPICLPLTSPTQPSATACKACWKPREQVLPGTAWHLAVKVATRSIPAPLCPNVSPLQLLWPSTTSLANWVPLLGLFSNRFWTLTAFACKQETQYAWASAVVNNSRTNAPVPSCKGSCYSWIYMYNRETFKCSAVNFASCNENITRPVSNAWHQKSWHKACYSVIWLVTHVLVNRT